MAQAPLSSWHEYLAKARDDTHLAAGADWPHETLRNEVVGAWNAAVQLVIESMEPNSVHRMINAYAKLVVRLAAVDSVENITGMLASWPKRSVDVRFQKARGASALEAGLVFARSVCSAADAPVFGLPAQTALANADQTAKKRGERSTFPEDPSTWRMWANAVTHLIPSLVLLSPASTADQFRAESNEFARVIADEEVASMVGRKKQVKQLAREADDWAFIPGGFEFLGCEGSLSGKPLRCLRALVESNGPMTLERLTAKVWSEQKITRKTVHTHLSKARKAVKEALSLPSNFDPMPAVDEGPNLAWEFRRDQIRDHFRNAN